MRVSIGVLTRPMQHQKQVLQRMKLTVCVMGCINMRWNIVILRRRQREFIARQNKNSARLQL